MNKSVLTDTSFLIELSNKNSLLHGNAKGYWGYFNENDIDPVLSPIVASEFWQQFIEDEFPSESFKKLTYNYFHGAKTAELNRYLEEVKGFPEGKCKACIRDDLKILSHLIIDKNIDYFITKDSDFITLANSLKEKFVELKKVRFIDIKTSFENEFQVQKEMDLK